MNLIFKYYFNVINRVFQIKFLFFQVYIYKPYFNCSIIFEILLSRAFILRGFFLDIYPRGYSYRDIKSSFWKSRNFYNSICKFPRFKSLEEMRTRMSKPRIYTSKNFYLEVKKYTVIPRSEFHKELNINPVDVLP